MVGAQSEEYLQGLLMYDAHACLAEKHPRIVRKELWYGQQAVDDTRVVGHSYR
ncbi:hypothetical protein [Segetibacter sp. 3557_3]|uniref:hypothetical protein n=1 Tax=Segetibacter sp. 3557_3 TaxID=2547429 RepID=UPI0014046479|nr:hypothetical protein [Segetibacter sp. 3557_3]